MNSRVGLDYVISREDYTRMLSKSKRAYFHVHAYVNLRRKSLLDRSTYAVHS